MSYQLFQFLFLFGLYIINSSEWNFLLNFNENNQILCYSCKGIECEHITNNDEKNQMICNKKTELCWAGFINQQPYRTCASRYCTPNDYSLDSDIHIETCCRSNLCNSISLSWSTQGKSLKEISSSHHTEITTGCFVDERIDKENESLSTLPLNTSDANNFHVNWDHLSHDKDFSNRLASISSILLFLMPLLLVLLL